MFSEGIRTSPQRVVAADTCDPGSLSHNFGPGSRDPAPNHLLLLDSFQRLKLCYPMKRECLKQSLLEIPHTLVTGHRRMKLELSCEHRPAAQLSWVWKVQAIEAALLTLHATLSTCQVSCAHWCRSGTILMSITSHFLIAFETYFPGGHSCLVLESQPKAHVWVRPRSQKEATAILLLNERDVFIQSASKCLCVFL